VGIANWFFFTSDGNQTLDTGRNQESFPAKRGMAAFVAASKAMASCYKEGSNKSA
jgi:hypothetical protein